MKRILLWVALGVGVVSCTPTPSPVPPTSTSVSTPTVPGSQSCVSQGGLPDPVCTPGATDPRVTQSDIFSTICVPGYTKTVRPPASYTSALKAKQMVAYGDTGPASSYEEDHRVPLEVGGNPTDPRNLWPEPWAGTQGAHAKDLIENRVHADVCDGKLTLAEGRSVFVGDWWAATNIS